jgi:hypothetical protein
VGDRAAEAIAQAQPRTAAGRDESGAVHLRVVGIPCGHEFVIKTTRAAEVQNPTGRAVRATCPACSATLSDAWNRDGSRKGNPPTKVVRVRASKSTQRCSVATCDNIVSYYNRDPRCHACQVAAREG